MSDQTYVVRDNPDEFRYEVLVQADLAGFTEYQLGTHQIAFLHTEVFPHFSGRGIAGGLAAGALDDVRQRGLSVVPHCPFIRRYIRNNPQYLDLVPAERRSEFDL